MSRGLVSAKPFIKKKRKKGIKWFLQQYKISFPRISFSLSNKAKKIIMWTFVTLILLGVWFYFLFQKLFLEEEYLISKVEFSENTIETYEDIELFEFLTKSLQGKNYYNFQYFLKDNLLSQAKALVPFVENIDYQITSGNILWLDLTFQEPAFRILIGDQFYGVRENSIEPLQDSMTLWKESFILYTPQYLSGTTDLSWFFFQISFQDLKEIIEYIQKEIPNFTQLMYFVWSTRFVIFTDTKQEIYFDFKDKNEFLKQFQKYQLIQKYYPEKNNLQVIDLAALDDMKVIIRKRK